MGFSREVTYIFRLRYSVEVFGSVSVQGFGGGYVKIRLMKPKDETDT